MKKFFTLCLFTLLASFTFVQAQMHDPVHVETSFEKLSDTEAQLVFTAKIDKGWHVYSTNMEDAGPTEASFQLEKSAGIELDGSLIAQGEEIETFDKAFQKTLRFFENEVTFIQKIKLISSDYYLEGYLEYGVCDDESCLPPSTVDVSFGNKDAAALVASGSTTPSEAISPSLQLPAQENAQLELSEAHADWWRPVIKELDSYSDHDTAKDRTLLYVFIYGFLGGLVALLTPCVWPIIPMTVSFFLKRSKDKKKALRDAIIYGVSIIVIYLTLGLAITLIFGPSALNSLATNAVFNIIFFLMLVVFAASFFGAFELRLPSKWSTAVDSKADQTTGLLSIFLMAFTLALVSFSCTGPIIGLLLVEVSTTGSVLGPAVGMFAFALALALPFTLFALFPSWLNSMPKSGGWMNIVKVSLGFVELALALKFLSVADLAYGWGILDREVFIALWIVIFALFGLYLLGKIKFAHDDDSNKVGVTRFFLALIPLSFAVYMVPGLWGAPLKAISAFAPPMHTQDFNLYDGAIEAKFDDYDQGMEYARQQGKPVMLDFTGYGCVNCRKMELAVWTDPSVHSLINDDYVLITLYVDNKDKLPEPIEVVENGQKRKLRTVGDKWSYLQRVKFGSNSQPFYVLVDNEGVPLNSPYAYNEDVDAYINFLETGLKNFKK
ncbi:MAG: cytochrome c biogenesis protein CcdA [Bacteroides sp.]